MEIEYAILANAAEMSDGKLYIMGGDISRIFGSAFPLTLPSISLVVKIVYSAKEGSRQCRLSVGFFSPEGVKIEPQLEKDLTPPMSSEGGKKAAINLILTAHGVTFDRPGTYTARVAINGEEKKVLDLSAIQVPGALLAAGSASMSVNGAGDSHG